MEIVRPQGHRSLLPSSNDAVAFPTLPLYRSAPPLEVRLEDFESFAIDRLRVLKGISDSLSRGKKPEEMEELVNDMWKVNMRHQHASEGGLEEMVSFYGICTLSLPFSSSKLLKLRVILDEFDLPYRAVSNMEFESIKEKLGQVARSMGQQSPPTADSIFYKVPFEEVPELVGWTESVYKSRICICCNASGCFTYRHTISQSTVKGTYPYKQILSVVLNCCRKWTSSIREQEKHRLTPIVEALCSSYLGPDFSQPREYAEISLKDIDQVAKSSFPLCMRHLFDKLREDHHLKHGGRMQLGLFLKGVGLNLDDALAFWRAEFSKKVGLEKFEKEYAYNIRHNYGKEGKRTDYTPYSCQKIISSTPGAGDQHGCPYRHFSEENLRAALSRMGVNSRAMEDVMDKVRNRHYQLACTLTFEALHSMPCDAGINHPNQYFSDSQKILQPKVDAIFKL
ncbi:DNA primase large subunit, eukaryotic/archaeal [Sesbania bispinosa]|nr:DNA primase large subunit, eukaryotic/archaeal [Sesbania bispinosa]